MAATRIKGNPGHLIVDAWDAPAVEGGMDSDPFDSRGGPLDLEQAEKLYEFLCNHVSLAYVVKQLYYIIKEDMPSFDRNYTPNWRDTLQEPQR